jgi:hypothetical protein
MNSASPTLLAPFAVAISWEMLPKFALLLGTIAVLMLIPHSLAAAVLAPERTPARIIAAAFLHALGIFVALGMHILALAYLGPSGLTLSAIMAFIIYGFVIAAIYKFSFGRAFLYNILVAVFAGAMGWTANKVIFSEKGLFTYFLGPVLAPDESLDETYQSSPAPAPRFATVRQAQVAAVERYPDLGKAGTPFNQRFLAKYAAYKAQNSAVLSSPEWPWHLANEVAGELGGP